MAFPREQLINGAETTLNGAITDAATSITLTDGTIYPALGDYRLTIESEIIKVTARSTHVLTVERGVAGTTAVAHDDLAAVVSLITEDNVEGYLRENFSWQEGNYFQNRDVRHRILDDTDTVLTVSDFTRNGPSTGEIKDLVDGSVLITPGAIGILSMESMLHTQPSTPYTLTAHCRMTNPSTDGSSGNYQGILLRDSGTNKRLVLMCRNNHDYHFATWSSGAAVNSTIQVMDNSNTSCEQWLRLTNDGTTMEGFVSTNGLNWYSIGTETVGTYLTPNQVGWGGQSRNKPNHKFQVDCWVEH